MKKILALCAGLLLAGCVTKLEKPSSAPAGADPYTALMLEFMKGAPLPAPAFQLADPGSPDPVDYTKYGTFKNLGTDQYQYELSDPEGLKKAVGEGIFPNEDGVLSDPAYAELAKTDILETRHWDALQLPDLQAAFFIWAQAPEEPGVKAYFTATVLENANLILPAIKANYAVLANFPRSACWAADNSFVWYVAPAALANIKRLCNEYPGLGLWLEGAEWSIKNEQDTDLGNDIISVKPGHFVKKDSMERLKTLPDLRTTPVVERRGTGKVQAVKYANGHWQLLVDGKPFVVRGVTYGPTEIGLSPDNHPNFGSIWQFTDKNGNGKIDAAYDAWVDKNGNDQQDADEPLAARSARDEPAIGDFQLMKDMGVNAIRFFVPTTKESTYDPASLNKPLLRDMHDRYGIHMIAGDFLGAYTVGSGASWQEGTDYTNPEQRARMKEVVRQKVLDLRGEPFLLMWLLGNENNMNPVHKGVNATRTNAGKETRAWAEFLNEVAQMIHELDPDHPVAIGNLGSGLAETYNQYAPAVDVFGMTAYMGQGGFGNSWSIARTKFDRPVLIIEYGCDAFAEGKGPDEAAQVAYHEGCLRDIVLNQAGGELAGNSIGGIAFEYLDEWWKANDDPLTQATHAQGNSPFPDGKGHEEWFGIMGQGGGQNSPFERQTRKAYEYYKGVWGEGGKD